MATTANRPWVSSITWLNKNPADTAAAPHPPTAPSSQALRWNSGSRLRTSSTIAT